MVGDVGRKVGGDAVGAHQHLVLVLFRHLAAQALAGVLVGAVLFRILHAAVPDGAVPVSYTHLDVYKRQFLDYAIDNCEIGEKSDKEKK